MGHEGSSIVPDFPTWFLTDVVCVNLAAFSSLAGNRREKWTRIGGRADCRSSYLSKGCKNA